MKASRILVAAAAAAGLLAGTTALAGVTNTRHDMRPTADGGMNKTVPGLSDRGVCSFCHVPHGSTGNRLWPGNMASGYTPVANLCGSCHLNTTIIRAGNESQNMFTANSHQFDETALTGNARFAQGQTLATSGLPYVQDTVTDIDCTSCHDPHSNTAGQRPFLRATLTTLCQKCHGARVPTGSMNTNTNGTYSQHPANGERGTTVRPITWNSIYGIAVYLAGGSMASAATSWTLGGHKTDGSAAATTTGGVTCVTCHPVHGFDPSYLNQGCANDYLIKVKVGAGNLCQDCHTATPGAVGSTTHPIESGAAPYTGVATGNTLTVNANMLLPANAAVATPSAGLDGATAGVLACLGCHDTHFGENNTPILVDTTFATRSEWCQACHTYSSTTGAGVITGARHHPSDNQAVAQWDNTSWTANADTAANTNYSATLNCSTCHRAHNARNQGLGVANTAQFLLRAYNYATQAGTPTSMMCVLCHTTNPAAYKYNLAGTQATHLGSHFVSPGNNNVAGGQPAGWDWTSDTSYNDVYLPAIQTNGSSAGGAPERNTNWPITGMDYTAQANAFSKYGNVAFSWSAGPTNSTRLGGVICESCHSITNPRSNGTAPANSSYFLLGQFNATNVNAADNMTLYSATAETAQGGDGLCKGCHGFPQGTHPITGRVVTRTGVALSTTSSYADASTTGGEAFYVGGGMTCTSCHDTHSGNTGAAFWILKQGNSGAAMGAGTTLGSAVKLPTNPDYTDLCAACHSTYR